ncbi:MAG: transglycosylase domain-containing protein [Candidatus Ratteibacteria bacterium]|nr:transglycosylase domain-containing protein [Candidatus Ratteibacteria bacterium]
MLNKKLLPLYLFGIILALTWGIELGIINFLLQESPAVRALEKYQPSLITKIYAENGEVIAEFFAEKRILASLAEMPLYLKKAVVVTEDGNFSKHWGIDFRGILRALKANILAGGTVQGGSTITQQLARNLFLTRERTLERKIREAVLSLQIEKKYSKDEILELYLNQIYLGRGAYGAAAASWNYFSKPLEEINLSESAFLAGLPRAPGFYSPFRHQKRALDRRNYVLNRMLKAGFISREEKQAARAYPIEFKASRPSAYHKAPYFVEYVRRYIVANYGENLLYRGGLKVYTTLDPRLQEIAEKALIEGLEYFDKNRPPIDDPEEDEEKVAEAESEKTDEPEETPKLQGALVAMTPRTGYIKVMVGGRDFKESSFNRAVQARRQPGSAFKPFVYTTAIDRGWRTSDVIDDAPLIYDFEENRLYEIQPGRQLEKFKEFMALETENIELNVELTEEEKEEQFKALKKRYWAPENYEKEFFGPTTLMKALERSRNVATIKLLNKTGVDSVVSCAEKMMNIPGKLGAHYSLALGTSELTVLELASGYSVLANHGIRTKPIAITTILDNSGNLLEENLPQEKEVIKENTAYIVTKMLEGVILRGTGTRARIGRPAAGKTGTTNDYTEAWFAGYTPDLVAAVYTGYDNRLSLGEKQTGGRVAAPIWAVFMEEALENVPPEPFPKPEDIVFAQIDPYTGLLAQDYCLEKINAPFVKETEPVLNCNCRGRSYKRNKKELIWGSPSTF